MKQVNPVWYVLIVALAVAPFGLRAVTWQSKRTPPADLSLAGKGEELFKHEWTVNDPLANGGDGLGPVYNATSCVACHHQGGVGGSGDNRHNVTTFTVRNANGPAQEGVVHARSTTQSAQETLSQVNSALPNISQPTLDQIVALPNQSNSHCMSFPTGVHISQRNTPALFGVNLIDQIPDRVIIAMEKSQSLKWGMAPRDSEDLPVGRASRLPNGRIGHFGWKAQAASLADFVQAACANELGLGNPGQAQPKPLSKPYATASKNDLTLEQCDQITAFCASLDRPIEAAPEDSSARENAASGKKLFASVGCADCHTPDVGNVKGLYSDLLLHRMGQELQGGGSYNEPPIPVPGGGPGEPASPGEWRTPPLWGVADSAPYMHDGRAKTLEDAIKFHGGQGAAAARKFAFLNKAEQDQLIGFLKTLRAP
jgi:CxxC motif-containing protein (DUF1111 family)